MNCSLFLLLQFCICNKKLSVKDEVRLKKQWILTEGQGYISRNSKMLATHFVVFCFHNDSFKLLQDFIGYTRPARCSGGTVQNQVQSLKTNAYVWSLCWYYWHSPNDSSSYMFLFKDYFITEYGNVYFLATMWSTYKRIRIK